MTHTGRTGSGRFGGRHLALAVAVAVCAAVWLAPSVAQACPQCALGRDEGASRDMLVAAIMAAPFVIVIAVARAIARIVKDVGARGGDEEREGEDGP